MRGGHRAYVTEGRPFLAASLSCCHGSGVDRHILRGPPPSSSSLDSTSCPLSELVGGKPAGWSAQISKSSVATPCAGPYTGLGHTQTTLSCAFFSDDADDNDGDEYEKLR